MSAVTSVPEQSYLVRVWFDKYAIATYDAERPLAEQYAAAMSRRLAGLRGTSAPLLPSGHPDGDAT